MAKSSSDYYQLIYMCFIGVGLILSIISLFVSSTKNSNILISSYSLISFGLILMIGTFIQNILSKQNRSFFQFLLALLTNVGPFLLLFGILAFSIYLVAVYKNKLDGGNMSSSYELFSRLFILFLFVQIYIMYKGTQNPSFLETGVIPNMYTSFVYLAGVINVSIVVILFTILKYFSTDGFSTL